MLYPSDLPSIGRSSGSPAATIPRCLSLHTRVGVSVSLCFLVMLSLPAMAVRVKWTKRDILGQFRNGLVTVDDP